MFIWDYTEGRLAWESEGGSVTLKLKLAAYQRKLLTCIMFSVMSKKAILLRKYFSPQISKKLQIGLNSFIVSVGSYSDFVK